MDTDLARWSDPQNLSREWDERAKLVADWLPTGARVVDIGCGNMAVEGLLRGGLYLPVDVVSRDTRTHVIDLNHDSLPDSFFDPVDHATLLGVLEYLANPESLLQQLARLGITLICSYQLADFRDPTARTRERWFHAFHAWEFTDLLHRCGFQVVDARRLGGQGLYLARPESPRVPPLPPPRKAATGRRLVLSGFFGRGNAGDEALLQVQYETLHPYFDITISVDERGAYDGFWNWYPYNHCPIIHHGEVAIFGQSDVVGLHVGGGDLPLGFNGAQVIAAASLGKTLATTGIDSGCALAAAKHNPTIARDYLRQMQVVSVRSQAGYEVVRSLAPHARRGADWAFRLPVDSAPETPRGLVLVVLREFPVKMQVGTDYRRCVSRLIAALERLGTPYALLPFCPEDERFLDELESCWGRPREVHWWNPRRLKQLIAQAKLVISVGRLHPLIFAATTGTPAVFSEFNPHQQDRQRTVTKAKQLCEETGIQRFNCFSDLCDWLEQSQSLGDVRGVQFPSSYEQHFENMVSDLLALFGAQR
jgi:hypothetical protein